MKNNALNNICFIIAVIFAFMFLLSDKAITAADAAQNTETYSQPVKIGDKLNIPGTVLKNSTYVDDLAYKDVTGDGVNDFIILAGVKEDRVTYSTEHTVIIQDGSSKKYLTLSAGREGGYGGKLFIGDFNGDRVPDIMIGAATGGSGGTYNYSILTFAMCKPAIIINQDSLSIGAQFKGHFKNGFKAEITSVDFNKTVDIDISSNKKDYVDNKIYNNNGMLLKPVDVSTDSFQLLKPVDTDADGVYELEGYQRLWGFCHVDNISSAKTLWKIKNGNLTLQALELSTSVHPQ